MPETMYVPLDGSGPRGCWRSLTSLEKVLILLSVTLGIFVFALTLALVNCKGHDNGGNVTTIAPDTTVPTTALPTTVIPTTLHPTTKIPTTEVPTTVPPTTAKPTEPPTTEAPSSTSPPASSTVTPSPKPSDDTPK